MGSNTEKKPIYKTYTKIEAKGLRAITKWGAIEKSNNAIAILDNCLSLSNKASMYKFWVFKVPATSSG